MNYIIGCFVDNVKKGDYDTSVMAIIRIDELKVLAIIGIHDYERSTKQEVLVSVELEYDITKAAETDAIEDTLDYDELSKKIKFLVEESQYYIIEKLASEILKLVLDEPGVAKARVRVGKPQALKDARCVSVEVASLPLGKRQRD